MTFKREQRVHFLFKDRLMCGASKEDRRVKRGTRRRLASKDPDQVTCVSCRHASGHALRTTHKDFLSYLKSKREADAQAH